MHSFRAYLDEAVLSRTSQASRTRKLKSNPKTIETLKREFGFGRELKISYSDVGHSNPYEDILKHWGMPPSNSPRDLLPLLWWTDKSGKIVTWEIPKGENANDAVHASIPEYQKETLPQFNDMTKYQGRIDRFRKIITIISGSTRSILADRAMERGKARVASSLLNMFKGYTILGWDEKGEMAY